MNAQRCTLGRDAAPSISLASAIRSSPCVASPRATDEDANDGTGCHAAGSACLAMRRTCPAQARGRDAGSASWTCRATSSVPLPAVSRQDLERARRRHVAGGNSQGWCSFTPLAKSASPQPIGRVTSRLLQTRPRVCDHCPSQSEGCRLWLVDASVLGRPASSRALHRGSGEPSRGLHLDQPH